MRQLTYQNVIQHLLDAVPETSGLYQDHLKWYELGPQDPELPRHPLFAQLAHLAVRLCVNPEQFENGEEILDRLFTFIEEAANSADDEVVNLVRVTFLDILSRYDNPCFEPLVDKMGYRTQERLREIITFFHQTLECYEKETGRIIPRSK